jgi:Zinc dependent phospholipase C
MRSVAIGLLTAILLVPSSANAWGFEAHKFIVSRAIDLLPEQLRPFFEANRAFIVERSIDPDLWRNAGFTEEPPNHFLDFDAYGPFPFADLPREYDAALKKHGIDKLRQNGLVPWRTQEMAGRLIRGFEALHKNGPYAHSDIRFFSAIIGHYVADAHVPLHAVLNYNGQMTGQTGIHNRWEEELFVRYQKELVIRPGNLKSISNERDYIFDTLLDSSQLADDVLGADKKAIGTGDIYDDRYFETLFAETRPILEKRLNDAITGVASMITSAWEQAGKPALSANPPPRTPQRRRSGQSDSPAKP